MSGVTSDGLAIKGGAGPYEAAVIAALVHRVLDEERLARARRPPSNIPSAWKRSGAPPVFGRFSVPARPDATGPYAD